jgi:hypothetical protein
VFVWKRKREMWDGMIVFFLFSVAYIGCVLFFFSRVDLQPDWFKLVSSLAGVVLLSSIVYNRHREYYRSRPSKDDKEDGEEGPNNQNFERKQFLIFTLTFLAYASILIAIGRCRDDVYIYIYLYTYIYVWDGEMIDGGKFAR